MMQAMAFFNFQYIPLSWKDELHICSEHDIQMLCEGLGGVVIKS